MGAYVERIKFSAVLWFSAIWIVLVYAPALSLIWGGGWLAERGVKDFAGGLVVHVTAGVSALVIARMLAAAEGSPEITPLHHPGDHDRRSDAVGRLVRIHRRIRTGGGRRCRHGDGGDAYISRHCIDYLDGHRIAKHGKLSLVGIVTGMVAGLATITPAPVSSPAGALAGAGGIVCYWCVGLVKAEN